MTPWALLCRLARMPCRLLNIPDMVIETSVEVEELLRRVKIKRWRERQEF